jgi:uncharacterized Zn finger protein
MGDYPCDDCGYEGPHTVIEEGAERTVLECGGCYREFTVERQR